MAIYVQVRGEGGLIVVPFDTHLVFAFLLDVQRPIVQVGSRLAYDEQVEKLLSAVPIRVHHCFHSVLHVCLQSKNRSILILL